MKRNVLFIVNSLGFGGAEKHVVSLLNHLPTDRFNLSLAYLKDDTSLLPLIDGQRGIDIFCCHVSQKIDMKVARDLARYIDTNNIDIVLCTNNYPLLYGWLARGQAHHRPRLIEVFHSIALATLRENLEMAFFWPLYRATDLMIYVCRNQERYWRKRTFRAKQVEVIYNGIDVDQFADRYSTDQKNAVRRSFGLASNDYVVGICAALRPEKNHGDFLAGLAALRTRGHSVRGLLIGDGPMRSEIERRIAVLGLGSQVAITGFQHDVRPLIAACDVMAITSDSETFSIAALEAMALGRPMIMTDVGGASEQIVDGESGYIYVRGDVATLARRLEALLEPGLRRAMGEQARRVVVEKFSLGTMIDTYAQLLSAIDLER